METTFKTDKDQETLIHLYRQTFPAVARMVKRYGGVLEDAQDVMQDALITWLEKPGEERLRVDNPVAYLTVVARNRWYKKIESKRKELALELPAEDEEARVTPELFNFLMKTGKKCMDLLQSFYYEKLSLGEIAAKFNFSGERSAASQKFKCIEKLRAEVGKLKLVKEDFYEN